MAGEQPSLARGQRHRVDRAGRALRGRMGRVARLDVTLVLEDDWLTIHHGDARTVLAELDAESVQTVVTSPPYFGLRDYGLPPATWADGWEGTLGLEPTPRQYVVHMLEVFAAIRRVLRPDGTVWLNIGDSYAASNASNASNAHPSRHQKDVAQRGDEIVSRPLPAGYKAKDRMMMPARVAIALCDDGWWLRDEIVWSKPNAMPSSVPDRTTPAHEMIYLLSKRARYHYDATAIRERAEILEFGPRPELGYPGHSADRRREKVPGGWEVDPGAHGTIHRKGRTKATYREAAFEGNGNPSSERQRGGINARWDEAEANGTAPNGRNKRSVWTVATQPYAEAHFATFPEKLIEPMILAGAPLGGVVLDPFAGSGTVGLVAQRLGRKAVLIDLSEEYLAQAIKRIAAGRSSGQGPAIDMPVPYAADGLWGTPAEEAVS